MVLFFSVSPSSVPLPYRRFHLELLQICPLFLRLFESFCQFVSNYFLDVYLEGDSRIFKVPRFKHLRVNLTQKAHIYAVNYCRANSSLYEARMAGFFYLPLHAKVHEERVQSGFDFAETGSRVGCCSSEPFLIPRLRFLRRVQQRALAQLKDFLRN